MKTKEIMAIVSFALGVVAILIKALLIVGMFFGLDSIVSIIIFPINAVSFIFNYGAIILGAVSLKSKNKVYSILGITFGALAVFGNIFYIIVGFFLYSNAVGY